MQLTSQREVASLQERYLDAVHNELRKVVPLPDGNPHNDIHRLLRYHLGWEDTSGRKITGGSGKALRPLLCLLACELAGGEWRRALPAAASLELIHNFSLIHDDVQDGDGTRRGRSTIWKLWGVPKAVAAGNAMRALADNALLSLSELGTADAITLNASLALTTRYMEMIEGQYLDLAFENSNTVTTSKYLDMISRKTGALVQSAMFVGALIATGKPGIAEAFGQCGRLLGQVFQVRDDYLGIWGTPSKVGKPIGSDIRRKKKSLPVVHVFQEAKGVDLKRLRQIYQASQIESSGVRDIMKLMDGLGTRAYVEEVAQHEANGALLPLDRLNLPSSARHKIKTIAEYFATREQ